jgi:hypothetical protein
MGNFQGGRHDVMALVPGIEDTLRGKVKMKADRSRKQIGFHAYPPPGATHLVPDPGLTQEPRSNHIAQGGTF